MKRGEFESLFPDQVTKKDVLSMLDNVKYLTPEEAEQWYDSAAKLYDTLGKDYTNFKINLANSLDTYVAQCFTRRRQCEDEKRVAIAFNSAVQDVQKYVKIQNKTFSDTELINRVTDIVYEMKKRLLYLKNKVEELEDKKTIYKLNSKDALQQISFAYQPIKGRNYEFKKLKSDLVISMFQDCFINYFKNKWFSATDIVELNKKIKKCNQAKKKLIHEGVKEIYKVFANRKLLNFDSPKDTYKMGIEDNGKYPSLNANVSIWILYLLIYTQILKISIKDKTHKQQVDYISNLMKDSHPYNWKDSPVDEHWKYFI